MELIYFISGVLTVGIIYSIMLFKHIKSSHTELLEKYQSHSNISSIRNADLDITMSDLKLLVGDIQANMEKDQYESLSGMNKKMEEIDKLTNSMNNRVNSEGKLVDKNLKEIFNEIQQIKKGLKVLGQDPNMLSRY